MNVRAFFSVLTLSTAFTVTALAHEPQNLKVISKAHSEKELKNSMKDLTKGLGLKCEGCHVKGKPESDDVAAKGASRDFFRATLGEKDAAKRKAALDKLLAELKLDKAKNEKLVWKAVDSLKKQ